MLRRVVEGGAAFLVLLRRKGGKVMPFTKTFGDLQRSLDAIIVDESFIH